MDIIAICAGKKEPKELAFMQTSMYWMLGREWLLTLGKSSDNWTASCIDVMKSINAEVYVTTPEQQNNLSVALGTEGASYLLAVTSAINASAQFPPGIEGLDPHSGSYCHVLPTVFAAFARATAIKYLYSRDNSEQTFGNYLNAGNWDDVRNAQITDVPAYQPVLPYGNPAGIDPGPSAAPPDSKTPPLVNPPIPTGIVPTANTPPAGAPTFWQTYGWPLGIGAGALAVIGGVLYFGGRKSAGKSR